MYVIQVDGRDGKAFIAYTIRANGDFLITGEDGRAEYVPHEQCRIVTASLTASERMAWSEFRMANPSDGGAE